VPGPVAIADVASVPALPDVHGLRGTA